MNHLLPTKHTTHALLVAAASHLHIPDLVPIDLHTRDRQDAAKRLKGSVTHGGVAVVNALLVRGLFLADGLDDVVGSDSGVLRRWVSMGKGNRCKEKERKFKRKQNKNNGHSREEMRGYLSIREVLNVSQMRLNNRFNDRLDRERGR